MLNNPSASITRSTHSQVSIREHSIPSGYLTTSASCSGGVAQLCGGEHNMIYSQVSKRDEMGGECHYGAPSSSMPTFQRQLNANMSTEFDNYSQVLSDDYEEEGSCEVMNYGDIDVTSHPHHLHHHNSRCQHADASSLPYSLKTSTQHGSILASSNAAGGHLYANASSQASDLPLKNMYRAVEYKKGIPSFVYIIYYIKMLEISI